MEQDSGFFLIKVAKNWHDLFEIVLIFSMSFVLSFGVEVQLFNEIFELFAIGV